MWRVLLQWMTVLWLLWSVLFALLLEFARHQPCELMRVQIVGAHYLLDFETGHMLSMPSPPPPVSDSMSPDGQYIVTVVGSPRGSSYRLLHNPSRTSELIGPYRAPANARTPVFWTDNQHLRLVTLSRDRTQTVLRTVNPASPLLVTDSFVYDFAAYSVRLSPDRQWLILGTEPFVPQGLTHSVYDVAVAHIETGELVRIGIADSVRLGWSRNGEWVVTQYRDDTLTTNKQVIRWYHIPTGRTFTAYAAEFEHSVVWSQNGQFAAYRVQDATGDYQLYLLNLDTLEPQLILSGTLSTNLYWLGDVLLVEAFTYPERTLYRLQGTQLVPLTTLPQSSYVPLALSPDGLYIIYHLREAQRHIMFRVNIASGQHQRLAEFAAMPLSIEWEVEN